MNLYIFYKVNDMNLFYKWNKNEDQLNLIFDLMPESLRKELNHLNVIPILNGEKIYFMIPHHIEIN